MNMPSQPLLWHIHHPPNCMGSGGRQGVWVREPTGCMGSGAGRVYGFGRPAGCMGSGGRLDVWVRGTAGCVGAGCGDSGGDGAFYSDDWSAFTHLTEHA